MADQVAITGASGFVGGALLVALVRAGYDVKGFSRGGGEGIHAVGPMNGSTDWAALLQGSETVVHLAARVHVMRERVADPLEAFREVNVRGTRRLAEEAVRAKVRRLVFVSSVKVNGDRTAAGRPFRAEEPPMPQDPYGQSKWEAEGVLREVADGTDLEVVIVRPPLVYGPGVKANFERLMCWIYRGVPLPFGAVDNRRSMVALHNLVDLLVRCVDNPAAAGQTLLVSDGEDLGTRDLVCRLASAMGRRPRLLPVPVAVVKLAGAAVSRGGEVERLCGSLQVDASETRERLNWTPPVCVDDALEETVKAFLGARR